jgi:hypothetical protein
VVNPDEVAAGEGDCVTAPDVLRVQLSNVDIPNTVSTVQYLWGLLSNILDDDVLGAVCNPQTFASDDSLTANTNDRLIRSNIDGRDTSFVVRDFNRCDSGTSIAVCAPVKSELIESTSD